MIVLGKGRLYSSGFYLFMGGGSSLRKQAIDKFGRKKEKTMTEELDREVLEESYVTQERLAVAAYYKWQGRGCPADDSLADWVSAHKEMIQGAR
jgi:hypothetical protein